jgi:putative phosphoribosyl transferase
MEQVSAGPLFRDREEAGRALAVRLKDDDLAHPVVLALPRGGVPVAHEVAKALDADFDIFLVRKIGTPGHEELAAGAIASGGIRVLNDHLLRALGLSETDLDPISRREQRELERRERVYREGRPAIPIAGRDVVIVDDGLATGASMLAVVKAVRQLNPARIFVAVPVAAEAACRELAQEVEKTVCVTTPEPFYAVSHWYEDFSEVTDSEVQRLLETVWRERVS